MCCVSPWKARGVFQYFMLSEAHVRLYEVVRYSQITVEYLQIQADFLRGQILSSKLLMMLKKEEYSNFPFFLYSKTHIPFYRKILTDFHEDFLSVTSIHTDLKVSCQV